MLRRRKTVVTVALVAAIAGAYALWPRRAGPSYADRPMEEWFACYLGRPRVDLKSMTMTLDTSQPVSVAFAAMGTNAMPFLAGRINRSLEYSASELLRIRLRHLAPAGLKFLLPTPRPRDGDALCAALLLRDCVKPSERDLRPLLAAALSSTNRHQRDLAALALAADGTVSGLQIILTSPETN